MNYQTDHAALKRFWYPVLPIAQLQDGPKAFTLLDEPLVLWLDQEGKPAATQDRCCHRSAKLSIGQVIEGCIRCPYHGWEFDPQGACVRVPQHPDRPIPSGYKINAYPCQERYGYVWVCLEPPLQDIPEFAEATDPNYRLIPGFWETWQCSSLRLLENTLDIAHIPFVHNQTFGDERSPVPPDYDLIEETDTTVHVRSLSPARNRPLMQKAMGVDEARVVRVRDLTWIMPFTAKLHLTFGNGLISIMVAIASPINARTSQIMTFYLRNDTDTPAEDVRAFYDAVAREDKALLEATEAIDQQAFCPIEQQNMNSDKIGLLMRRRFSSLLERYSLLPQCGK